MDQGLSIAGCAAASLAVVQTWRISQMQSQAADAAMFPESSLYIWDAEGAPSDPRVVKATRTSAARGAATCSEHLVIELPVPCSCRKAEEGSSHRRRSPGCQLRCAHSIAAALRFAMHRIQGRFTCTDQGRCPSIQTLLWLATGFEQGNDNPELPLQLSPYEAGVAMELGADTAASRCLGNASACCRLN